MSPGFQRFLRAAFAALFLLVLASAGAETRAASRTLVIDGLGKGAVPLDGPWQFHLGDDLAWARPDLDDSGWEQIATDAPWGAQKHHSYAGFAWYRRRIGITPAPGASPDFAMLIRRVEDAYEIYWNGVLVGKNGSLPPHPMWYFTEPPQTFGLGPVRSGVLAVRVWKAPMNSFDNGLQGGFYASPMIGSPQAIAAAKDTLDYQWLRRRQFNFGLNILNAMVVLLGFAGWLRDRSQKVLLAMAGMAIVPIANLFLLGLPLGIPYAWALGLAQPFFGIADVSLWFVLIYLLQLDEIPGLARLVRIAAIVDLSVTTIDGAISDLIGYSGWALHWVWQLQLADAICTAIFTLLEIIGPILILIAVFRRRSLDHARWLVAFFAFTTDMITVVRIAAQQGSRFTHWTFAEKITAPLFTISGNPFSLNTISAVLLLLSIIYAVYRYISEHSRRQAVLEQEFKSARELQQVLVPETLPKLPGFAITSAYRPAQEVGGDFFQIIPLESGATLVILGDVSGKGLRAAMAVSLIVGAARMIAEYSTGPAAILAALNRRLYGRMQGGFATCLVMRLDADGSCVLASAGHPAPFLNQQELALPGALPLGLDPSAGYDELSISLRVGDHCALYTDGLLEARNRAGELYGFGRLETLFASRPNAAQVTEAAVSFGQDDDITVLTLTRLAASEESVAVHSVPNMAHA